MTEYQEIMNGIARNILDNNIKYDRPKDVDWAFVHAVEKQSKCYARHSIMSDAINCLSIVRSGCVWYDRNCRTKHNPDELARIREATTRGSKKQQLTEDQRMVNDVLAAIRG